MATKSPPPESNGQIQDQQSQRKAWIGLRLHNGRIYLTNNAAERALRGIGLGQKSWLFAGSDCGGQRVVKMYGLIVSAKMNNIYPQAWLADVLARIADHPVHRLEESLHRKWKARSVKLVA